jgi:hypothetical protein
MAKSKLPNSLIHVIINKIVNKEIFAAVQNIFRSPSPVTGLVQIWELVDNSAKSFPQVQLPRCTCRFADL